MSNRSQLFAWSSLGTLQDGFGRPQRDLAANSFYSGRYAPVQFGGGGGPTGNTGPTGATGPSGAASQ